MAWAQLCSSGLHGPPLEQPFNSVQAMELYLPTSYTETSQLSPWILPLFLLSLHQSTSRSLWDWHVFESRSARVHLIPRAAFLITPYSPESRSPCMNRLKLAKLLPHLIFNSIWTDSERWSVQHLAHQSAISWRHNTGLAITWFTNLWFLSCSFRTIKLLHKLFLKLELK